MTARPVRCHPDTTSEDEMSEADHDHKGFAWDQDFWEWSCGDTYRCKRCGHDIESWTEEVPCCGPEYPCFDVSYIYACHHCRLTGDTF